MPKKTSQGLSDENVCQILLKFGLISEEQKQEILVKKTRIKSKLEQIQAMRQSSASSRGRIGNPITIVDVISSLDIL